MDFKKICNNPFSFGQGRDKAFASVEELKPACRDIAARVVPRLRNAAIISAGCQSDFRKSFFSPFFTQNHVELVVHLTGLCDTFTAIVLLLEIK